MRHPDATTATDTRIDPVREELVDILHGGRFEALHRDLRALFEDDEFHDAQDLTWRDEARRTYNRFALVVRRLPPLSDVVAGRHGLFALLDWAVVVDPTLATTLSIHASLCLGSILTHGRSRSELADYIAELESARTVGLFMATELGHGSNLMSMETVAEYDAASDEFVITTPHVSAAKFMPASGLPDVPKLAVVLAQLRVGGRDRGIFPFIVRLRDDHGALCAGVICQPLSRPLNLAMDCAVTRFDAVRVPRRNWLCGHAADPDPRGPLAARAASQGDRYLSSISALLTGRLALGSAALAAARASLTVASRYAHWRETGASGRSRVVLIEHAVHRRRLLGRLVDVYAATALVNQVKNAFSDRVLGPDALDRLVTLAKVIATDTGLDAIQECRALCGAQGMLQANRIATYVGFDHAAITAEGDNQVLLARAARHMLRDPSWLPPPSGRPEWLDNQDPQSLTALLRYAERHFYEEARERWAHAREDCGDAFAAWNRTVGCANRLALLHGARLAAEELLRLAGHATNELVRRALEAVARIYVLRVAEQDAARFVAAGLLDATASGDLDEVLEASYAELQPLTPLLVDGFAMTEALLRTPITNPDPLQTYDDLFHPVARRL